MYTRTVVHISVVSYSSFLVDLNTINGSDFVKDKLINLRSKEMVHHDFKIKIVIKFFVC